MKEIEILNKITGILENLDEHEVRNIQTQIEKLSADRSCFRIEFETVKTEEEALVSISEEEQTETEENSENVEAALPEAKVSCYDEKIEAVEYCEPEPEPKYKKKRPKGKKCIDCINCYADEEINKFKCCKGLKEDIESYTSATFCEDYKEK